VEGPGIFATLVLGAALAGTPGGAGSSLESVLAANVRSRGVPGGAESLRIRLRVEEPDFAVEVRYAADRAGRVRVDVFHEGRLAFAEGVDERGAWSRGENDPVREASSDAFAALEHGRLFNLYGLEELPRLGHRLVLEQPQTRDGRTYEVVRIELSDGFRTWRWIDAESGRLEIRRDFRALHPDVDATPVWIETRLSDFRSVGGAEMAFASRQVEAGTERWLQATSILDVEQNVCLTDSELRRPGGPSP
jgi:hypothetical protein